MATSVVLAVVLICCLLPSAMCLVNCTRTAKLLTQARYDLTAVAACDRVYIAGGQNGSGYPDLVEVYNTKTRAFETPLTLPNPRPWLAGASTLDRVLFIGGGLSGDANVDVWDCTQNTWTNIKIPGTAEITNLAAAGTSSSGKVVFGGGYGVGIPANGYLSGLYIYNAATNTITTSAVSLSPPRRLLAASAVGNKVLFGGGEAPSLSAPGSGSPYSSNKIEIYDITTDTITDTFNFTLNGRQQLAAATAGTRVAFGGGEDRGAPNPNESYSADTWNSTTNQLYFEQLFRNRVDLAAAGDGTVMMFAGGVKSGIESNFVDIFDVASEQWTAAQMGSARTQLAGAAINNVFVFAGGFNSNNAASNGAMRDVDVFECSYPPATTPAVTTTAPSGTTTKPSGTTTAPPATTKAGTTTGTTAPPTTSGTTAPPTASSSIVALASPVLLLTILIFALAF